MGEDSSPIHRMKAARLGRGPRTVVVAIGVAVLSVLASAVWPSSPDRSRVAGVLIEGSGRIPQPVAPAFTAADPIPIRPDRWDSVWALVKREIDVHARPRFGSPVVGRLSPLTPEGTDNIVLVLDRRLAADDRLWVRVSFPSLPNGASGWIERSALGGYGVVHTRLVIDLGALRAKLYKRARLVFEAPVGVGKARWPTPIGEFFVRNRLVEFDDPFYGPVAFGTSARSAVLTDWPAGGFVGIHGTATPELIPGRVSHGCVRMRNADILRLDRLMPVGTPVRVRP
jgi:hypothetical protein